MDNQIGYLARTWMDWRDFVVGFDCPRLVLVLLLSVSVLLPNDQNQIKNAVTTETGKNFERTSF